MSAQRTPEVDALYLSDPRMVAWWATYVECLSGISRLLRDRVLTVASASEARSAIDMLFTDIDDLPAVDEVRETAVRLLPRHPLRAADALQLAAALEWAGQRPLDQDFVSLDNRLREAARLEGFRVLP